MENEMKNNHVDMSIFDNKMKDRLKRHIALLEHDIE